MVASWVLDLRNLSSPDKIKMENGTDSAAVGRSQRSGKGIVDMSDLLVLVALVLATVAYLTKGKIWALKRSDSSVSGLTKDSSVSPEKTRNIVEKMRESVASIAILNIC